MFAELVYACERIERSFNFYQFRFPTFHCTDKHLAGCDVGDVVAVRFYRTRSNVAASFVEDMLRGSAFHRFLHRLTG